MAVGLVAARCTRPPPPQSIASGLGFSMSGCSQSPRCLGVCTAPTCHCQTAPRPAPRPLAQTCWPPHPDAAHFPANPSQSPYRHRPSGTPRSRESDTRCCPHRTAAPSPSHTHHSPVANPYKPPERWSTHQTNVCACHKRTRLSAQGCQVTKLQRCVQTSSQQQPQTPARAHQMPRQPPASHIQSEYPAKPRAARPCWFVPR